MRRHALLPTSHLHERHALTFTTHLRKMKSNTVAHHAHMIICGWDSFQRYVFLCSTDIISRRRVVIPWKWLANGTISCVRTSELTEGDEEAMCKQHSIVETAETEVVHTLFLPPSRRALRTFRRSAVWIMIRVARPRAAASEFLNNAIQEERRNTCSTRIHSLDVEKR